MRGTKNEYINIDLCYNVTWFHLKFLFLCFCIYYNYLEISSKILIMKKRIFYLGEENRFKVRGIASYLCAVM